MEKRLKPEGVLEALSLDVSCAAWPAAIRREQSPREQPLVFSGDPSDCERPPRFLTFRRTKPEVAERRWASLLHEASAHQFVFTALRRPEQFLRELAERLRDMGCWVLRFHADSDERKWKDERTREQVGVSALGDTLLLRKGRAGREPEWRKLIGGEPRGVYLALRNALSKRVRADLVPKAVPTDDESVARALHAERHSDPLSETMARELARRIEDDTGLTRREREMLWLELQGVGPAKIAEQCAVELTTVYVTLRNARRKIQPAA